MSSQAVVVPHVKKNSRPSGFAAYAKAVRKYNIDTPVLVGHQGMVFKRHTALLSAHQRPHRSLRRSHHHHGGSASAPPDDIGPASEVSATDIQNDLQYVVPVTIGTPGVTLNLDFDTGSSDLWVWSSELRGSAKGHHVYNPKNSSTAKEQHGSIWGISYGDGSSATGNVYLDTVKIGSLIIPNQAVELAQKMSELFQQGESDGLLGLAWPSINTVKPNPVATPLANIIDQKLASGIFSVALDQGDNNGFYTFGGIDAAKAGVQESDITYTAVDNSEGFWMFPSEVTTINGKAITQSGNTAILDTGTTLCMLSDDITNAIYKGIPGAQISQEMGGWVYPADAKVPNITLSIGAKSYALNQENFGYGGAGGNMVFGGIQSRGNNPFDILGDVFLKSIYAVFDHEQSRVGVAHRSGNVGE